MADIDTTIKLQDRRALSAQPDTGVAKLPGLVRPTLDDRGHGALGGCGVGAPGGRARARGATMPSGW